MGRDRGLGLHVVGYEVPCVYDGASRSYDTSMEARRERGIMHEHNWRNNCNKKQMGVNTWELGCVFETSWLLRAQAPASSGGQFL